MHNQKVEDQEISVVVEIFPGNGRQLHIGNLDGDQTVRVRRARQVLQHRPEPLAAQCGEQALPIRLWVGRDGALREEGLINHQGCRLEGSQRLRINPCFHAINGSPMEGDRDRHAFLIETRVQ